MSDLVHKETFMQPAHDGIPTHWVVQYYEGKNLFACYFNTLEEALEFEEKIFDLEAVDGR